MQQLADAQHLEDPSSARIILKPHQVLYRFRSRELGESDADTRPTESNGSGSIATVPIAMLQFAQHGSIVTRLVPSKHLFTSFMVRDPLTAARRKYYIAGSSTTFMQPSRFS